MSATGLHLRIACMRHVVAVLLLIAMAGPEAQAAGWKSKVKRVALVASQMAVAGASAADLASSWGGQEANPLLRGTDGRFGARGAAVKFGMVGGIIALERLWLRDERYAPVVIGANAAVSVMYVRVAQHNLRARESWKGLLREGN